VTAGCPLVASPFSAYLAPLSFPTRRSSDLLETRFRTAGGSVVVTDFMPAVSEEEKHELLLAEHEILRLVRCEGGEVEIESVLRRSEEHTSELQSRENLVCRLLLEKKKEQAD